MEVISNKIMQFLFKIMLFGFLCVDTKCRHYVISLKYSANNETWALAHFFLVGTNTSSNQEDKYQLFLGAGGGSFN